MIEVVVPCSCPSEVDAKGVVVKAAPIHDHDTVSIPEVLDARLGAAGTNALSRHPLNSADLEGALSEVWLHNAPRAWTLVDAEGDPLPVTIDNIDARLTWNHGGFEIAEKANGLYAGDLFSPLVKRMPKRSRRGQTDNSTSATPSSGSDQEPASSQKPSLRAVSGGRRSGAKAS